MGKDCRKRKIPRILLYALLFIVCILLIVWILRATKPAKEASAPVAPSSAPLSALPATPTPVPAPTPALPYETGIPDDLSIDYDDALDKALIKEDFIEKTMPINRDVMNILLLSEDTRADADDKGHSNSMTLVSYDQDSSTIRLLSFLRDIYIYIPGRDYNGRLNTAFRYGGTGLAVNTINANFELDIRYYIKVGFDEIIAIIDLLGGVDMDLTEAEVEYINAYTSRDDLPVQAGIQHLDGEQALAHCRNRSTGDGDWGRSARQRNVIVALTKKVQGKGMMSLLSLGTKLMKLLDTNLSLGQIVDIALAAVSGGTQLRLEIGSIPFANTWQYASIDGKSVISMDLEKNVALLHTLLYGEEH